MSDTALYFGMAAVPSIFSSLISEDKVSSWWGIVNIVYPLAASVCLVYLSRGFLKLKWKQPWMAVLPFFLHLVSVLIIGWEPGSGWPFPGLALLGYLVFLIVLCCAFYRGDFFEKVYIATTFYAFYLLIMLAMAYIGYGLFHLVSRLDASAVRPKPPVFIFYTCPLFTVIPYETARAYGGLCNMIFLLLMAGACCLIVFAGRFLAKKLRRRTWKMGGKELVFLLLPESAGISFYVFMTFVKPLLFDETAVNLAKQYGLVLYIIIPALAVGFLAAILYSCDIFEQIMLLGQEKGKSVMLLGQVEQLELHIREIEQLYTGIRRMKHDMKNYLFDIRNLLDTRGICVEEDEEGLGAYFSGIGKTLEQLDFRFHTGNPITDVIVNGKYQQARQMGIEFSCSFSFPKEYGISAFDIGVILNNALDNALEACGNLQKRKPEEPLFIQIETYCRNNMYFIEIANRFDGILRYEETKGELLTRKDNAFEHGLGFQNLSLCAEKYLGKAAYRYSTDTFYLTVMLQRVWNS